MLAGDVCTRSLITIDSNLESLGAAQLMAKHGFHSLVVVANNRPVGIITKTDIIKRIIMKEIKNPEKRPVVEFMTKSLLTVREDTSVMEACRTMMEYGVRHLLVIKKQVNYTISRLASVNQFDLSVETQVMPPMVGILSIVDILENIPKLILS